MDVNSVRNQYYATLCVNLIAIAYGCTCGWSSPNFPILLSSDVPLDSGPITVEEASWVGSILCIGGFTGTLLFGYLADIIGRKLCLILLAFPESASWILILVATDVNYLLASRFLAGICGGGLFVLIPGYIAEISEDKIRGTLSSMLVLSTNIGMLISFVIGDFLPYKVIPIVLLALPILFFVGFIFMPETPLYLFKNNKLEQGEMSLRFYRNVKKNHITEEFQIEMDKYKTNYNKMSSESANKVVWADFTSRSSKKAFIISIALMALNQLCGCFAMLNYTATIFYESGSTLTPNMSAIVVGVIQLIGAYISTILVDRLGRKFLIVVSALGTSLGLAILGAYMAFKTNGYNVDAFDWVPVTSFSFVIFIANWGVLTLPFVVLAEVMPDKIRSFATTFCMAILFIFAFIMIKYFSTFFEVLGMHGAMFLFSSFSLCGALFTLFIMPETKGQSFDAITLMLSK